MRSLRSKGLPVAREERHLRQRREQRAAARRGGRRSSAGRDVRRAGGRRRARRRRHPACGSDDHVAAARHDERPRVQRVRRDERERERVESPDENGAAVREVVAVEPDGVERIRPSHGWRPRSSPPTHQSSWTIRPSVALVDDEVVDRGAAVAADLDLERRQLGHLVVAGEDAARARARARRGGSTRGSRRGRS